MRETAHDVLKLLGLHDHQAVIVEHTDRSTIISISALIWSIPKQELPTLSRTTDTNSTGGATTTSCAWA